MKTKQITKIKTECIDLVNMKDDLPEHQSHPKVEEASKDSFRPIELMNRLLQKAISSCAAQVQVDEEELQAWVNCQIEVPHKTILHLLRSSYEYKLDPLKEEILITLHLGASIFHNLPNHQISPQCGWSAPSTDLIKSCLLPFVNTYWKYKTKGKFGKRCLEECCGIECFSNAQD